MKMIINMRMILCIVMAFVYFEGNAQAINRRFQDFEALYRIHNSKVFTNDLLMESDVVGSPYLEKEFAKGEIYTHSFEVFTDVPLRYNMYNDEVEFMLSDSVIYDFADPSIISKIKIKDQEIIFSEYSTAQGVKKGFFFVLNEGKSILCERRIKNYSPRVPSTGIVDEKPPRFSDVPISTFIKLEGELPRLFKSKSDLLEILNKHDAQINNYLKKEKINVRDTKDIIQVLKYYDSL